MSVIPKVTSKLILRPQDGFTLHGTRPAELMMALQLAAHLTEAEARATCLFIEDEKNIAVIKTTRTTAAAKIDKVSVVTFEGRSRKVCTYILPPDNSCKGVIHKIRAGTSSEDLMAHLSAGAVPILNARMMGRTETALITFQGSHVPRTVLYRHGEYRCVPHHPKAQFCTTCFAIGHRADICPQAGTCRCRHCGAQLSSSPGQHHSCNPRCVNCGKNHAADSPTCPIRRKADIAVTKAAYLKRLRIREQYENRDQRKQVRIADQPGDSYARSVMRQHHSRGRSHSLGRDASHSRGHSSRSRGSDGTKNQRSKPPPNHKVMPQSRGLSHKQSRSRTRSRSHIKGQRPRGNQLQQCWFAHTLRRFVFRDWSIEQKWMSILLPFLLLHNDPVFPMSLLVNSWIPGMLDAVFQASFLCALLLFWLCVYHGIRQNERRFAIFYLPKLLVVGMLWTAAFVLASWQRYNELRDPTYNYKVDTHGFAGLKIFFFVMGSVYLVYLVYLVVQAYAELRSMPYFDVRLKFMTSLMLIVLTLSVVITVMRFGISVLEDNFVADLSTTYGSSAEFMSFYGLLNFYLYTMAYVYSPPPNAFLESHLKDNPTLSMMNDSDEEVIYGSDTEERLLNPVRLGQDKEESD